MNIENIFKNDVNEYQFTLDPIKDYMELAPQFLSVMNREPIEDNKTNVKKYIKETKQFTNPKVLFYERQENGDKNKTVTDLYSYMKYVKSSKSIIAPSFTVYFNPNVKRSLHAEFIEINVKDRSIHKKLAFKHKMAKDFEKFNYHNTLQKSMKIYNNSLSGAYASQGTVLNNPSSHYTLTSITRCVSGIGNALSESIIAGNKHFKDPDTTLNHIVTVVSDCDKDKVLEVTKKYNLHVPNADELMRVILKSSRKYWKDTEKELVIYNYLKRLAVHEKVYVAYHNDLFHLRMFNDEFMREMITNFLDYDLIDGEVRKFDDIISSMPDWLYNFVIHILSEQLIGKKVDDYSVEDKRHMASIGVNLISQYAYYGDIFNTFLITKIFPVSIGTIKDMVREAIVLSDTDSTCASYADWVTWYFREPNYSPKSIGVTAAVMTAVAQATDHYIKLFGTNLNVPYSRTGILEMKNEFFWKVFVNSNVSKHYFASIFIQEGNIFDLDPYKLLEKKGVHLIAPNAYGPVRELAEKIMVESMQTVFAGGKINMINILDQVVAAEAMIVEKLNEGSPEVLKLEKIKEAKSYKLDADHSPFVYYKLWQDVFSYKYGNAPDPTYMAIKFPSIVTNKRTMELFLDEIDDKEFSMRFKAFLKEVGKTEIKTFRLPLLNVYNNGIPKELMPVIDSKRVIMDNCKVLYIVLEALGFYLKEDMTLTEYMEN